MSTEPRSKDAELRDALRDAGFTQHAHRHGQYTRWHFPKANKQLDISLVVPEDPQAPEYAELLLDAIAALQRATRQGAQAQQALNRLVFWETYHASF
jgi:hypothetical protein